MKKIKIDKAEDFSMSDYIGCKGIPAQFQVIKNMKIGESFEIDCNRNLEYQVRNITRRTDYEYHFSTKVTKRAPSGKPLKRRYWRVEAPNYTH